MDPAILLNRWWQVLDKTVLFIVSVSFLSLLCLLKFTRTGKLNLPPSPPKLPIIGNLHQFGSLPHRSFRSLAEKYGPVMLLHSGYVPTLIVSSPEIAMEVLKTHVVFADRPRTRAANVLFYGCSDVAFCPYGEYWRQAKKICILELLSQRRVQAFQFAREEEVAKMLEKLHLSSLSGDSLDLGEMLVNITNSIISRSALGRVYENENGGKSFGELSRKAMDLIGSFCFEDFFPHLGWMDALTGFAANLERTAKELHDFLDQVIEEHQISESDDHKSGVKDLVDILLYLKKEGRFDIQLSKNNIKAILMDMFIGATDTTAVAMEWAMAELVKNPSIMKKAQEEVRRVVGRKSKVDETDVDKMEYLKCVFKETLRLHAPAVVTRQTSAETKLEGYDIPPKTTVLINAWAIQRDPNSWDKPEEFIPERFANTSIDFKGQHSQFIPFGAGRRGCPGMSFAVVEAEYVLANLLCWFDWKLPDGTEDLDMTEVFRPVIGKKVPLHLAPVAPTT